MMAELAKLAGWLLSPLSIVMGLWIAAWLLRGRPRLARGLAVLAFALLWICATPLMAQLVSEPLETRYPAIAVESAPTADAIVVLGGALIPSESPGRPNMAMGRSADRIWQAAALYRAGKAPWVVVAAGNFEPREGLQVEADAIARMLQVMGVPPEKILLERSSRNTRENAANVRSLTEGIGAKKVILVTSSHHLPRAMATFAKSWRGSGIALEPFPADVSGTTDKNLAWSWIPSVDALRDVTKSLKEYAGMVSIAII